MLTPEYLISNNWKLKQKMSLYTEIFEKENNFGFHFELHKDYESGEWWLQIDDDSRINCGSIWIRDIEMLNFIVDNYR